jgi:hypothetical protein
MGFLDKAKAAAEQAAAKAKEGVEDVQTKRELAQAYSELGRATFELIESGDVSHQQLTALADKIRELNQRVAGDGIKAGAAVAGPSDDHDTSQPPAMPT